MDPIEALYAEPLRERLTALAEAHAPAYATAQPFPHTVIDDFLPLEAAEEALRQFPTPEDLKWFRFDAATERKLAFDDLGKLPPSLRNLLYFLNSPTMLQFLEKLTGIEGLIADSYFNGGGLHQLIPGGYLKVHADFNKIPRTRLLRRINLLIYLNKDWTEDFGGQLELWNEDMTVRGASILPLFNRCVIFNTTSESYHGNPNPIACPEGNSRKSIAIYYYVADVGETAGVVPHSTLWREPAPPPPAPPRGPKQFIKRLTPPIVLDAWRALKR